MPSFNSVFGSGRSCATTHGPHPRGRSSSSLMSNVQKNPVPWRMSYRQDSATPAPTCCKTVDRNTNRGKSPTAPSCGYPWNCWRKRWGCWIQFPDGWGHSQTLAGATLCTVGDDVRLVTRVDVPPHRGARVSAAGSF